MEAASKNKAYIRIARTMLSTPQPPEPVSAQIDRLGPLKTKVKQLRKLQEQVSQIQNQILAIIGEFPADKTRSLEGQLYLAEISARQMETNIDIPGVYYHVGAEAFLARCGLTLEALKVLIPDEVERSKYIARSQTGERRFTVLKKAQSKRKRAAKAA